MMMIRIKILAAFVFIISCSLITYAFDKQINDYQWKPFELNNPFSKMEKVELADEWYNSQLSEINENLEPLVEDNWWETGLPNTGQGGGGFVAFDVPIADGLWILSFLSALFITFKIARRKK